jgi:hypothetical protein
MARTASSRNESYYHYKLAVYMDGERASLVKTVMYKTQRELLLDLGISRSGCHRLLTGKRLLKDSHLCLDKCHEPVYARTKLAYN